MAYELWAAFLEWDEPDGMQERCMDHARKHGRHVMASNGAEAAELWAKRMDETHPPEGGMQGIIVAPVSGGPTESYEVTSTVRIDYSIKRVSEV